MSNLIKQAAHNVVDAFEQWEAGYYPEDLPDFMADTIKELRDILEVEG